jgi:lysophospholipase L1-like esterase
MPSVRILRPIHAGAAGLQLRGNVVNLADGEASALVGAGAAEWILTPNGDHRTNLSASRGNTTVMCGDSITGFNNTPDANGRWSDQGYVKWADFYLNARLDIVKNAGIPGNTCADLLGRIFTDVIAFNPQYVIELCGTNDLGAPLVNDVRTPGATLNGLGAAVIAQAVKDTVANVIRCKATYYQAMLEAGIKVFACSIGPSSDWLGYQHGRDIWAQVTAWQRSFCLTTPGMTFVDVATPMIDSQSAASVPKNQGVDNDGLHPYTRSAQAMGLALADELDDIVPAVPYPLFVVDSAGTNNPGGNTVPNPRWTGAGGTIGGGVTVTGTMPDAWQIGGVGTGTPPAVTVSKVAHPLVEGAFLLQCAVTFASVATFQGVEVQPIAPLSFFGAAAGDLVDWDFEYRILSADGGALGFSIVTTDFDAGFGVLGTFGYIPNVITLPIAAMPRLGRWVSGRRPYQLAAGTNGRYLKVAVFNSANNPGTITFQLGRLAVRKRVAVV